jgi:hypothetical protein
MKRAVRAGVVPVTLIAGLLLGMSVIGAAADKSGARRLHFDVQFSPFNFIDSAPPAGPSNGDLITSHDVLLRADGSRAGRDGIVCTLTDVDRQEATCHGVFHIGDRGNITVQFLNTPPPRKIGAVTGGTGEFTAVGGVMRLVEHGDGTGAVTFMLTR